MHVRPFSRALVATGFTILVAGLTAGCESPPGSDADLSKLAAAAPAQAKRPSALTIIDGPGGTRRVLANLDFLLSPDRNEAQLVFHASLNPDCSDVDGVDIKITLPPQHGTATVVHGPGYVAEVANTPYAKCMSSAHVGKRVVYRRDPGFVGVDQLTYDAYFPNGSSIEVHYKLVSQ